MNRSSGQSVSAEGLLDNVEFVFDSAATQDELTQLFSSVYPMNMNEAPQILGSDYIEEITVRSSTPPKELTDENLIFNVPSSYRNPQTDYSTPQKQTPENLISNSENPVLNEPENEIPNPVLNESQNVIPNESEKLVSVLNVPENEISNPIRDECKNTVPNESDKLVTDVILPTWHLGHELDAPSPFKNSLFWPKIDNVPKSQKNDKLKLPSQATSEEWIRYHQKKEETKFLRTQEIENKKKTRIEAKLKKTAEAANKQKEKSKKLEEKKKLLKQKLELKKNCKGSLRKDEKTAPICSESQISKSLKKFEHIEIKIDDFVVVKYDERQFVARIEKIKKNAGLINISCLRPYQGRKDVFSFPIIPDYDDIPFSQIVKTLPKPDEFRSRYHFHHNCF